MQLLLEGPIHFCIPFNNLTIIFGTKSNPKWSKLQQTKADAAKTGGNMAKSEFSSHGYSWCLHLNYAMHTWHYTQTVTQRVQVNIKGDIYSLQFYLSPPHNAVSSVMCVWAIILKNEAWEATRHRLMLVLWSTFWQLGTPTICLNEASLCASLSISITDTTHWFRTETASLALDMGVSQQYVVILCTIIVQ